ncbi:hypothetical protein FRX31_034299 [Thalictrum thalictroides]|uniref:Transmembrane protein n=1 Tax=Thalictrum thalictroides TaxID=46969 RepID=A0A7J6UU69_THATH|nr:hypothetical protein FRX31_034299 [Thalictrum thalictroides]
MKYQDSSGIQARPCTKDLGPIVNNKLSSGLAVAVVLFVLLSPLDGRKKENKIPLTRQHLLSKPSVKPQNKPREEEEPVMAEETHTVDVKDDGAEMEEGFRLEIEARMIKENKSKIDVYFDKLFELLGLRDEEKLEENSNGGNETIEVIVEEDELFDEMSEG